jgi:hypothetical protein
VYIYIYVFKCIHVYIYKHVYMCVCVGRRRGAQVRLPHMCLYLTCLSISHVSLSHMCLYLSHMCVGRRGGAQVRLPWHMCLYLTCLSISHVSVCVCRTEKGRSNTTTLRPTCRSTRRCKRSRNTTRKRWDRDTCEIETHVNDDVYVMSMMYDVYDDVYVMRVSWWYDDVYDERVMVVSCIGINESIKLLYTDRWQCDSAWRKPVTYIDKPLTYVDRWTYIDRWWCDSAHTRP